MNKNQSNIIIGKYVPPNKKTNHWIEGLQFLLQVPGIPSRTFCKNQVLNSTQFENVDNLDSRVLQITFHVSWSISKENNKRQLKFSRRKENLEDPSETHDVRIAFREFSGFLCGFISSKHKNWSLLHVYIYKNQKQVWKERQ